MASTTATEDSRKNVLQTKEEKKRIVKLKQQQIDEQRMQMEDMALQFGTMLKATLDKVCGSTALFPRGYIRSASR